MKVAHSSGKRKRAIARATVKQGKGVVKVNNMNLDHSFSELVRLKIMEPILLADTYAKDIDVHVNVMGGGIMGQADAARLAIARALVAYSGSDALKKKYLDYDRHLLVADIRRKEQCKPNDSKARAKRQKSYR